MSITTIRAMSAARAVARIAIFLGLDPDDIPPVGETAELVDDRYETDADPSGRVVVVHDEGRISVVAAAQTVCAETY